MRNSEVTADEPFSPGIGCVVHPNNQRRRQMQRLTENCAEPSELSEAELDCVSGGGSYKLIDIRGSGEGETKTNNQQWLVHYS